MHKQAMDSELIDLERQFWDAMRDKDPSAARLSDERCVVVGPSGIGEIDRKALAEMIEKAPYDLTRYSFDEGDIKVRMVADDVAIVAYPVKEDLVVDGKALSMKAYDSSVWVRRDGKWLAVLHTETIAGDPFGRHDRTDAVE